MTASITFFPVGNGDMTLITFDNGQKLLADLHVRKAADDDDDDTPDVMADLRGRLTRDEKGRLFVDGFLLSHPDKDHICGLESHFHLGPPDEWNEDDDKILIREMWSSPVVFRRASKDHVLCDDAKAWAKEARRRVALYREKGTATVEGDRIQIMGEDEGGKTDDILAIVVKADGVVTKLNRVASGTFEGRLLAPIPQDNDGELDELLGKNHSSVVLRFSIRGGGVLDKCRFLTGGDAEVAIWERLWGKHGTYQADWLSYDILQAPHHCSWHSLSYDSYSTYGEDAKVCDDARSALAQIRKGAIVVASSKAIDPDEADPPSDRAKREYISIVEGKSDRFICVADVWEDEERALQYEITSSGITKVVKSAAKAAVAALGIGATAAQARAHG
ncbi:ComEC/Rec2 family competence protein [Sphingomonas sp. RS6]